jgi:hypothetical protein
MTAPHTASAEALEVSADDPNIAKAVSLISFIAVILFQCLEAPAV